jgi:prepilin-type N-terminal cleavage/methylation domain-containing protein
MKRNRSAIRGNAAGFTLLEVMVSLIIGVLIVGGVMGAISMSINHRLRVQQRLFETAVLEAAAQQLLAQPRNFESGSVTLDEFPGSPQVGIQAIRVELDERPAGEERRSQLYRVLLSYARQQVELSVIVPPAREGK